MNVALRNVTKTYKRIQALDDVSLEIAPGQIVAVLGANGAGKTTLLRCLAGIVAPGRGQVLFDGTRFDRSQVEQRRRLFILPDFPFVFEDMTILRHIAVTLRLYHADGEGAEQRALEWLDDFDLLPLAEMPFNRLSRGQRYKAALAMFLAVSPELWMLDEPFASGMDPQGIQVFKAAARVAAREGCTVIYTTQILDVAERFADRVGVLDQGRVRAFGTPADLQAKVGSGTGFLEELFQRLRDERP